jgi:hypothetical protein
MEPEQVAGGEIEEITTFQPLPSGRLSSAASSSLWGNKGTHTAAPQSRRAPQMSRPTGAKVIHNNVLVGTLLVWMIVCVCYRGRRLCESYQIGFVVIPVLPDDFDINKKY